MNIRTRKTGFVFAEDVLVHIEQRLGYKIQDVIYEISEKGDHDKGTFERKLEKISFSITDKEVKQ